MKKILVVFTFIILVLNLQWHYDRMCASVFSPGAYFKLDGVYCEVGVPGAEFRLDELLARHKQTQEVSECMLLNPDKTFICDPRWIPPSQNIDA